MAYDHLRYLEGKLAALDRYLLAAMQPYGKRDVTAALREGLEWVRCPPAIWWTPDDDGEEIERA
jgi:hypothetical protein